MKRRGWHWPLLVVALLVGSAGANIAFMLVATGDASFAVEPDYYRKALAWDQTMAQEARNAALGWRVELTLERVAEPGQVRLIARVADGAGAPVSGATVAVETFHGARAGQVLEARLLPREGGGYAAVLPMRRPGLWEVRLRVERGGELFTGTILRDVAGAP